MQNPLVAIVGILVVGAVEGLAILNGVDGTALAAALSAIGAIVGFTVKSTTKQGGKS